MELRDIIKQYRAEHGLTMEQFAEACGLSKGYISMLESGKHPNNKRQLVPSLDTYKKLSTGMRIPIDNLLRMVDGDSIVSISSPVPLDLQFFLPDKDAPAAALSNEESRLIRLFRRADEIDKRTVMSVLSRYETAADPAPPVRMIRHYLVPAAAGYASPIEGEEYENIPLPQDAPQDADFCIDIQGDSMEPFIKDGQRVYIKRDAPLKEFDPGVFFVDGDMFCKQFCPGYNGEMYLLSANPDREDANITIRRGGNQNCVYFGKVLLDKKLPKPQYK